MSNFKRYLSKSCLLSIMLAASMNIYSQITLNVNATSVKSVINQIEKQSDYRFFFEDNLPGLSKEIDINVEDQSINQVLDEICSQAGISYTIKGDKQVVIHAAKTASVQQSSNKTIKGVVVDNAGIPIIGANIMVKGTTNGTITDMDGNFTLDVPAGAVLQISYIGYANQEVKVGNSSNLSITLKEDTETLDEVVVVGYGTQKKINLTGSTSVVTSKDLVKRVTPNAANMLQGKASGLQITSTSGQPGNDDANIRIRGIGTFGAGSNPLILVDGVEGELSSLNSNDIESVTVLKDAASAAIYGSRAANGVILVTTKKGTKGFSVEYTGNFQVQKAASRNLVTNSADYMEAYNEARVRSSQPLIFTEEEINNFRNGTDPIKYPNFDWEKHMIKPAFMHSHHISVKGGDEKTKYNLSLGYLSQDGITDGFDYDRINGLVNISSKLSKYVTVGANLNLQYSDRNSPVSGKGGNVGEQIFLIYAAAPNFMPKLPDGSDRWARTYKQAQPANRNPEAVLAIGNRNHKTYSLNSQVFADVQLLDNLTWSTKMAVNYKDVFFKQNERNDIKMYNYNDGSVNLTACGYNLGLRNQSLKNLFLTVYSTLQYSLKVGNHDLTILGGYSQEKSSNRNLDAYRPNMPFNDLTEINAGSAENQTLGGGLEEWALRSFFGRLNYSFKNRYLFEANVRYDGTSRMSPDHRWGVFPSF